MFVPICLYISFCATYVASAVCLCKCMYTNKLNSINLFVHLHKCIYRAVVSKEKNWLSGNTHKSSQIHLYNDVLRMPAKPPLPPWSLHFSHCSGVCV